MVCLITILSHYTMGLIVWAFVPMVVTYVVANLSIFDLFVGLTFATLGLIDLNMRINKLNNKLMLFANRPNIDIIRLQLKVERFTIEHNNVCCKMSKFSRFWKDIYLAAIFILCPITLIILHLVLFESMNIFITIMYVIILIDSYAALIVVQYVVASISHKMHKQCKLLARIQWLFDRNNSSLRFKLKTQTYFERLSSKKRIGFSIGTLVVITFPLFVLKFNIKSMVTNFSYILLILTSIFP